MNNGDSAIEYSKRAEALVNKFNVFVLSGIFLFAIIAECLNAFGFFKIEQIHMLTALLISAFFIWVPIMMFVWHDGIKKNKNKPTSILYKSWYKWIIITAVFISVGSLTVSLTHHAIILIVLPPLLTAQYKADLKLILTVFIASALLVPISVYGGFFFGCLDKNLVKGIAPEVTNPTLAERLELAKDGRMMTLFTHYVIPRSICVFVIDAVIFGISARFVNLNKETMELQARVNEQMTKTNKIQSTIIDSLAALIENRDSSTGEHVFRTKKYVELICEELINNPVYNRDLTEEKASYFIKGAPLHDVGKIMISDIILLKPAKLNAEEFAKMKTHSEEGRTIIKNILHNIENDEFVEIASNIAAYHHERWDGTGYPEGLRGRHIPLEARIMAVADVFDALVSKRVYKDAFSIDESFKIIEEGSGTHFDPEIVRVFLAIRPKIEEYLKIGK